MSSVLIAESGSITANALIAVSIDLAAATRVVRDALLDENSNIFRCVYDRTVKMADVKHNSPVLTFAQTHGIDQVLMFRPVTEKPLLGTIYPMDSNVEKQFLLHNCCCDGSFPLFKFLKAAVSRGDKLVLKSAKNGTFFGVRVELVYTIVSAMCIGLMKPFASVVSRSNCHNLVHMHPGFNPPGGPLEMPHVFVRVHDAAGRIVNLDPTIEQYAAVERDTFVFTGNNEPFEVKLSDRKHRYIWWGADIGASSVPFVVQPTLTSHDVEDSYLSVLGKDAAGRMLAGAVTRALESL
jgi:hypothetical protein